MGLVVSEGPVPILFVHDGAQWIRGSERCLIDHIADLDRSKFLPVLWTNNAPLAELMRPTGTVVILDDFVVALTYHKPKFDFVSSARLLRRCAAIVREHQIKIIHCNAPEPCQWVVPVAKRRKIPIILQLHLEYSLRMRCVCLLHQVSHIVGVSRATLHPLLEDGFEAASAEVIYNCVDAKRLLSGATLERGELDVGDDQFVFLAVGSLIKRKGFDLLIEAFAGIEPAQRNALLLVAGDGPERGPLQEQARALGIADRVRFLGETPIVPSLMRDIADSFVLTSRVEAFPLVLLEAGFFGLPCIGTEVGGVAELVENERTGLTVPPESPAQLSAAMRRLLDSPSLRQAVGSAIKARIAAEMVAPLSTRKLEAIYERCLLEKRARQNWRWYPVYSRWLRQMRDSIGNRILRREALKSVTARSTT